jgi:CMP-N,N'-diacetyllegionaminic acid synthase
MKTLYLIPARGGSKGLPGKNIKALCGKPLIYYTLDVVKGVATDADICVSTDSDDIIATVEAYGLKVPFKRPAQLALDTSGSYDVLIHALNYYEALGIKYDNVMLLQPTSPFRKQYHLEEIQSAYNGDIDMIVSVAKSHQNPYFTLFEEGADGFLMKSKQGEFESRQMAPPVYFYNGSLYLINCKSLKKSPLNQFQKVRKYVMDDLYSVDIDGPLDWALCETILKEGFLPD